MNRCKKPGLIAKLLPIIIQVKLLLVSVYCLFLYDSSVSTKDPLHFGYCMYIILLLNNLVGLTMFASTDESFCDLRLLLDYAQVTMVLPCYATVHWQVRGMAPPEVAIIPALFGIGAMLFFVLMEYKRQDLTDLAMIISGITLMLITIPVSDYIATAASVLYLGGYFALKRKEVCGLQPNLAYNYVTLVYSVATLAAFSPDNWVPNVF